MKHSIRFYTITIIIIRGYVLHVEDFADDGVEASFLVNVSVNKKKPRQKNLLA